MKGKWIEGGSIWKWKGCWVGGGWRLSLKVVGRWGEEKEVII